MKAKMAALNVTLASVAGENSNSTIDMRSAGMKSEQECHVSVPVLPANGGQTVSSCLSASGVTLNTTNHHTTTSHHLPLAGGMPSSSSSIPHASVTAATVTHNHIGNAVPGIICTTVAGTAPKPHTATEVHHRPISSVVLTNTARPVLTPTNAVGVPRVRINTHPVAVSAVPQASLRTLAPRIVVNSSPMPTIVRVQQPPTVGAVQTAIQTSTQPPGSQQIVMPIRTTTQGQLVNRVNFRYSPKLWSASVF